MPEGLTDDLTEAVAEVFGERTGDFVGGVWKIPPQCYLDNADEILTALRQRGYDIVKKG